MPHYLVNVIFENGTHHATVQADTPARAITLAVQDARMGSAWPSHFVGKLLSTECWDGEEVDISAIENEQ